MFFGGRRHSSGYLALQDIGTDEILGYNNSARYFGIKIGKQSRIS